MIITLAHDEECPDPDQLARVCEALGQPVMEIRRKCGAVGNSTVAIWQYVDPVRVELIIRGGDTPTNVSEKREVVRRMIERGLPLSHLEDLGWQPNRYQDRSAA